MSVTQEIIQLPLRFDFSQHRSFIEKIDLMLANSQLQLIEIDFSQVQFIDSSALGMLVLLHKKVQGRPTSVSLKGCRGPVLEILKMAKMDKLFSIS